MNNRIYIKAWYGDWHAVGAEKTKDFCRSLMEGMTCTGSEKKRRIEENHLKGITLDELMAI